MVTIAKGYYHKWLKDENLIRLHGWKMQGLTDKQIAQKINVTSRTFEMWKAKFPEIRNAIKGGKEVANFIIENKLFEKAKSGNVTAMIFYLKNNYREKYTDDVTDPELRKAQIKKANVEVNKAKLDAELTKIRVSSLKEGNNKVEDKLDEFMKLVQNGVNADVDK